MLRAQYAIILLPVLILLVYIANRPSPEIPLPRGEITTLFTSIKMTLQGNLDYLVMLADQRARGELDLDTFTRVGKRYVDDHPELINLTWVDEELYIRGVTPWDNNEQIIGLHLDLDEPASAAVRARQSGQPVYTKPFEAIQGMPSFEVWVPVYREDRFLGLMAGVYSCKKLLARVTTERLRMAYQVGLQGEGGYLLAVLDRGAPLHLTQREIHPVEGTPLLAQLVPYQHREWLPLTWVLATISGILLLLMLRVLFLQHREIKARQDVQEALRISEERNRLLIDNIDVGITLTDPTHRVLTANAAMGKIYRQDPDEFIGRKWLEGDELQESDEPIVMETRGMRGDGTPFTALKKAFPLKDDAGVLTGFIEMVQDITERKQAEDERLRLERQVQHAQKLESLGMLAGGIAHDFNNLLMGVLGNTDLVRLQLGEAHPTGEYLTEIEQAARRAADLCSQMLAYSGKGRFVIEPINLSRLIHDMVHILQVSVSKNARLKYHCPTEIPLMDGDANQVRQVIMNLITNASDAIGKQSGMISVTTGRIECTRMDLCETYLDADLPAGLYVYFEVADTGCGMNKETRQRLFEPFFTIKFTGRGLGMAAVLGIIRGHRGAIKVYSEPGKGTNVRVLFPATHEREILETPRDLPEADQGWKGVGTILVIDDEETLRSLSKAMLERMGFSVLLAEDGVRGLCLYREFHDQICCVLLDLTMPRMDGEDTLHQLRAIRADLPVLLTSGYNEQDVNHRFKEDEPSGFIHKPYAMNALREKIREILTA